MPIKKRPFIWTEDLLKEEISKYTTLNDFIKGSTSAYSVCCRKKLIDTLCKELSRQNHKVWTLEEAKKEALKYKYKKDFQKFSAGCYSSCCHKNWIDIVCGHMKNYTEENTPYTEEKLKEVLSNFSYMEQLKKSEDKFRERYTC